MFKVVLFNNEHWTEELLSILKLCFVMFWMLRRLLALGNGGYRHSMKLVLIAVNLCL